MPSLLPVDHVAEALDHFVKVLGNENVHYAFFNALAACGGGTVLAVVIGLAFSWIVVRTNTPCKGFIGAASMIPLFVPPLVAGVAWSILGSPKSGLINTLMKWAGIDWRIDGVDQTQVSYAKALSTLGTAEFEIGRAHV